MMKFINLLRNIPRIKFFLLKENICMNMKKEGSLNIKYTIPMDSC
jgi:hypothetical protein